MQGVLQHDLQHLVLLQPPRHPVGREVLLVVAALAAGPARSDLAPATPRTATAVAARRVVGHGRDDAVHLVQRVHLAPEGAHLQLPQDHLQAEHLQLVDGLGLVGDTRRRGRDVLEGLDNGGEGVVLGLGLGLLLEVLVAQVGQVLGDGLDNGDEVRL